MTRRGLIFAAAAALATASACARPPAAEGPAPAAATGAVSVDPADVRVDVSAMRGDVAPETVEKFLRIYAGELAKGDAAGREAAPVIRMLNISVADPTLTPFTGQVSSLSGEVALLDKATGETIVAPAPLDVDVGPHLVGELIGVVIRDRAETKAEKMSLEFMRRARVALYGPNN